MLQTGNTICFKPFSLNEALRGLSEAGFENVEIGAVKGYVEHIDPDRPSVADVRAALARHGLRAVSLSGHSELHRRDGLERGRRVLAAAAELEATTMSTYTRGVETTDERRAFIRHIRSLADESQEAGVRLCLETDGNLAANARLASALLTEIAHPWLALNYDPANAIVYSGVNVTEDLEHALPRLGHVHLKDKRGGKGVWDFPPLGEGELELDVVLRRLQAIGFTGPVSMEIEFNGRWPSWDKCLAAARRGKAHWDRLLVTSRAFV